MPGNKAGHDCAAARENARALSDQNSITGRGCPPKNLEGTKAIELTQAEPRLAQP